MAANQSAASAQAASADWVDVDFSEDFRSSFLDLGPAQPRSGEDEHRRRQRGSDAVGEDGAEERKEAPEDAQPRGGGWLQRLVQWMHRSVPGCVVRFRGCSGEKNWKADAICGLLTRLFVCCFVCVCLLGVVR